MAQEFSWVFDWMKQTISNLIVEQVKKEHVYLSVYRNMKSAKAAVVN